MTPAARLQAAIEIVDAVIAAARDNGPAADTIVAVYFKQRRYAGAKDRRAVRAHVFDAIRAFAGPPPDGRAAFAALAADDPALAVLFDGSPHGPAPLEPGEGDDGLARGGVPGWIIPQAPVLADPAERAALAARAPLDLRVNPLRAGVEEVRAHWPDAVPIAGLAHGLRLAAGTPIEHDPLYRVGAVEVQDAGSQVIAAACRAAPGQLVIDLCAGAGGKTLALAADMIDDQGRQSGRLVACDAIARRIAPLAARAARAGAVVETRLLDTGRETAALADLAGAADVVLVDAPCSGTGTWRRNPEGRWRLTPARLARVIAAQARLLDIAAELVKPGGALVYAVCSLVEAEGAGQVAAFLSRRSGWRGEDAGMSETGRPSGAGRLLTPAHDGCDGFHYTRLVRG